MGKASEEQAEHPAAKPVAKPAPAVTGSTAAEARIRGHAAESEVVAKAPLESSRAASQMERGFQSGLPPSPSVVVIDTLELLRGFERAGFSAQQAEAITRATLAVTKSSVDPLATKSDLERHILGQLSELREFKQDIGSRHREAAANSKHMADMVLAECEKLRAELVESSSEEEDNKAAQEDDDDEEEEKLEEFAPLTKLKNTVKSRILELAQNNPEQTVKLVETHLSDGDF